MLYLVATPIGNLKDITLRAIETLQSCDYILCEDTRHSQILLKHYNIQKPLKSFHKFNEASKENQVIDDLKAGQVICLISDAGTPGISDPGIRLVKRCIQEGLPITAIPGACAAIAALSISGLDTDHFSFLGFLPRQHSALKKTIKQILESSSTTICYESPERIDKVLGTIQSLDPERELVLARELTKKFEEFLRGKAQELASFCIEKKLKGEIVLLITGKNLNETTDWGALSIEAHVAQVQQMEQLSLNEAIKKVAEVRSLSKRIVYNKIHQTKNSDF